MNERQFRLQMAGQNGLLLFQRNLKRKSPPISLQYQGLASQQTSVGRTFNLSNPNLGQLWPPVLIE